MDLLRKELERKKKALQAAKESLNKETSTTTTSSSNEPARRRFFKGSQLREKQEQQEEAERQRQQQEQQLQLQQQQQQQQNEQKAQEALRSNKQNGNHSKNTGDSSDTARQKQNQKNNSHNENDHNDGRIADPTKRDKKSDRKRRRDEANKEDKVNLENNQVKQQSKSSSSNDNDDITTTPSEMKVDDTTVPISSIEITKQLRNFGLPIRLFGEVQDAVRYQRLQHALQEQKESLENISEKDEYRLGQGHGIRNPFLERRENSDSALLTNDQDPTSATTNNLVNDTTKTDPTDANYNDVDNNDDTTDDPHKRVYRYFKNLLKQWEADLSKRPEDVKRSVAGKKETNTVKQCKDYIRPLFKLCKNRTIEDSMLQHLLNIVTYCEQGEFVKAHDAYMDIAIGRAAWPIGVTMVGIHARTGRAKIESQNVAHVMNSELQRKYLTSVKRLMTYNQNKRTDVDPSKKVLN